MRISNPDIYGSKLKSSISTPGDFFIRTLWTEEPSLDGTRQTAKFELQVSGYKAKKSLGRIPNRNKPVNIVLEIDSDKYHITASEYKFYTPVGVELSDFSVKSDSNISELVFRKLSSFKKMNIYIGAKPTTSRLGESSYAIAKNISLNGDHFRNLFGVLESNDNKVMSMVANKTCNMRSTNIIVR